MTAYVIPPRGGESETARALLDVAESPYHVATDTDNGLTFRVHDYVADAYEALQRAAAAPADEDEQASDEALAAPQERPAQPRAPRARKEGTKA